MMAQSKEGVKGHHFFMDGEMRGAHVLKPDKTGKALLTVLRHLGRLQEVRRTICSHGITRTPACGQPHQKSPASKAYACLQLRLNVEGSMQPVYILL